MSWERAKGAAAFWKLSERKMRELQKMGYPVLKCGQSVIFDCGPNGESWMREHFTPEPPLDIESLLRNMSHE